MTFHRATKTQARLRLALIGPAGSGKTFTALRIATGLGGRVALIDTERASASKYADRFQFDTCELDSFHPHRYIEAIEAAEHAGYDVLAIDSLSHAWTGKDGALELVDAAAKRTKAQNTFAAWREVTPLHNALVDAILRSGCHVIATMRSKTEYVVEAVNGRQVPRKVGLAPVQREGMEYEFDVVGDLDESTLVVTKTRCPDLTRAVFKEPGEELGRALKSWLSEGASAAPVQRDLGFGEGDGAPATPKGAVPFGPHRGKAFTLLSEPELEAAIAQAASDLRANPQSRYAAKLRAGLAELEAERLRRRSPGAEAPAGARPDLRH